MRSARLHIGYGQPHDSVTHHCAGWARGLQSLRQAHGMSGSKSRSANDGSSSVVTVTKAKVKVETSAGGARKICRATTRANSPPYRQFRWGAELAAIVWASDVRCATCCGQH